MQHMMKTKITNSWYLALCLAVIVSLAAGAIQVVADDDDGVPLVDVDGDEVLPGVEYNIVSFFSGGGLTLRKTGNKPCPLDVVHERRDVLRGLPLTFHPNILRGNKKVLLYTPLNIKFNTSTPCPESTVWRRGYDESIERVVVTTGGVLLLPVSTSWFTIQPSRVSKVYKLSYCLADCVDFGIYNGGRLTEVRGEQPPFQFVIFKAANATLSAI